MRNLIFLIAVACTAQTPTQIDYNGNQIKNKPTTYTAIPGANTLSAAITKTPSGGTLIIPSGSFTVSGNVLITTPNITLQCMPGAVISPSVNNIHVLLIEAANVAISGCTFTGNSTATNIQFIFTTDAAAGLTVTGCTFENVASAGSGITFNIGQVPTLGLTLHGNTFKNLDFGVTDYSTDLVDIQDQTCLNIIAGDCAYNTAQDGDFTSGARIYIRHIVTTGGFHFDIEVNGLGFSRVEVIDCVLESVNVFTGISVTVSRTDRANQSQSTIISNNQIKYVSTPASPIAGFGIESYGAGLIVSGNRIIGTFSPCVLWAGSYAQLVNNYCSGMKATNSAGLVPNLGNMNQTSDHALITGNTFVNLQAGAIWGNLPGGVVTNNIDLRAPGQFAGDSALQYFSYFVASTTEPLLFDGNESVILPAVNGYSMPGTMSYSAYFVDETSGDAPTKITNGAVTNLNSAAFGTALQNSGPTGWIGNTISGMTFTNMAAIFAGNPCGNTQVFFRGNLSLIGTGSGLPPTACIIGAESANVVYSETGSNNTIAGSAPTLVLTGAGSVPSSGDGTGCVTVILAHSLQAGANTFTLNGGAATNIRSHFNQSANIATGYASSGTINLCLSQNGAAWLDQSQ